MKGAVMTKTPREQRREATIVEIKATARRLMAEQGTAGLTVRGITKEMGITPPALYRYFDRLDDLITALIAENFHALADAVEAGRDAAPGRETDRLIAAALAYRRWALDNPVDFELIYGTPIPGYQAPQAITVPASARTLTIFVELFVGALANGECQPPPPYDTVPPVLVPHLERVMRVGDPARSAPLLALYLALVCWPQIHGLVMLELLEHIGPVVGDMEFFARSQFSNMIRAIGFTT
jgi:AcrR family transcriptional regulator